MFVCFRGRYRSTDPDNAHVHTVYGRVTVRYTRLSIRRALSSDANSTFNPLTREDTKMICLSFEREEDSTLIQVLDELTQKIEQNSHRHLVLQVNASTTFTCMLLRALIGCFENNRAFDLEVSNCMFDRHSDIWVPSVSNFITSSPTLHSLELGFITTMPQNLQQAIIHHPSLEKLMIGHDGGFDTDHDQLFDAESYVLTHGRLNNFKLLIYRPQLLPDHFVQALRENTMLSTFHLEFVHLCRRTFDYTNLSEQIQSTLCKCQSVNSIAHSNHTLNVNVVCPNKFSHSITRLCAINNLHMENNNAMMLKIREKCFLYPQLFEMWIQTLQTCNRGSDSDSDDESFDEDSDF